MFVLIRSYLGSLQFFPAETHPLSGPVARLCCLHPLTC